MSTMVQIIGGPYEGMSLTLAEPLPPMISLRVNDDLQPDQAIPPFAFAVYQQIGDDAKYNFLSFQRADGQPFTIEFSDGPAQGKRTLFELVQHLNPEQRVPLSSQSAVYDGKGEVVAVAIYLRRHGMDKWKYYLDRIDVSPEAVRLASEEITDQKVTAAMNNFYLSPDYDIYSLKPTESHPQVPIQLGHRRALVDEKMATVILGAWRLGLDTLGSCQQLPPESKLAGQAYIEFPRRRDAQVLYKILCGAGIPATLQNKTSKIGRRASPGLPPVETSVIDSANVVFSPGDLERVVVALSTGS